MPVLMQGQEAPPVYHAVVTSTRTYMDASRTRHSDYWFTREKSCISNGRVTTIERRDQGLIYTMIIRTKKYHVDTIRPSGAESGAEKDPGFRYLGLDYNPVYDWSLRSKTEKDSTGQKLEHFTAIGEADFDHAELDLWLGKCNDPELTSGLNLLISNSLGYMESRKPMVDRLKGETARVPCRIEETVENSIAPPEHYVIDIRIKGRATPPDSVFELPANYTKEN